jgi:hypothetical protein
MKIPGHLKKVGQFYCTLKEVCAALKTEAHIYNMNLPSFALFGCHTNTFNVAAPLM